MPVSRVAAPSPGYGTASTRRSDVLRRSAEDGALQRGGRERFLRDRHLHLDRVGRGAIRPVHVTATRNVRGHHSEQTSIRSVGAEAGRSAAVAVRAARDLLPSSRRRSRDRPYPSRSDAALGSVVGRERGESLSCFYLPHCELAAVDVCADFWASVMRLCFAKLCAAWVTQDTYWP